MKLKTALKLGRVSNLPTVWTNCLVGFAIAGVTPELLDLVITCFAFSFLYTAGMFLNDVFDYKWDMLHQPDKPITANETSPQETTLYSVLLLVAGIVSVVFASTEGQVPASISGTAILIACILIYDWKHKKWTSFSPWLMGICRLMVYCTVALTAAPLSYSFVMPGLCLMTYIAGITYLAKAEHLNKLVAWWPIGLLAAPLVYAISLAQYSPIILFPAAVVAVWIGYWVRIFLPGKNRAVSKAVANLLAGICLIDVLILVGMLQYTMAALGMIAFLLTLFLQKRIKAT